MAKTKTKCDVCGVNTRKRLEPDHRGKFVCPNCDYQFDLEDEVEDWREAIGEFACEFLELEDVGNGPYEYWGARGNDSCIAPVLNLAYVTGRVSASDEWTVPVKITGLKCVYIHPTDEWSNHITFSLVLRGAERRRVNGCEYVYLTYEVDDVNYDQ